MSKWTLLVISTTDKEVFNLKPRGWQSVIFPNMRMGYVVSFISYGGEVTFPGHPSYIKIFKDAIHYANVPVEPGMKRYWVFNEECDIDIHVLDSHLVSQTVSSQAGPRSSANGCTCGVWVSGGVHSDWCDKRGQSE